MVGLVIFCVCAAQGAQARMALVVGEPFGSFGTMMPQGHAGIYMSELCVETAVKLRPCRQGEYGAVISRYHDLRHPELDWMAFPLTVFLYGTSDVAAVPTFVTPGIEADLRERYREAYLSAYLPARTDRHGDRVPPPYGDWEEGIGAAFDRRLLVYSFDTSAEQDQTVLDWLNGRPNQRAYTLTRHNCADFAADLLRIALPREVIRRNVLADFDMTTPKNLAREVDGYGRTHPELHLQVYEVPQIAGTLRRSRPMRGAAESLITTKRYFAVVVIVQPELMLANWIIYEKRGKWTPGQDAVVATPMTWQPELDASTAEAAEGEN